MVSFHISTFSLCLGTLASVYSPEQKVLIGAELVCKPPIQQPTNQPTKRKLCHYIHCRVSLHIHAQWSPLYYYTCCNFNFRAINNNYLASFPTSIFATMSWIKQLNATATHFLVWAQWSQFSSFMPRHSCVHTHQINWTLG